MPSIVRFVFNEVSAQCVALLLLGKDRTVVAISKSLTINYNSLTNMAASGRHFLALLGM